MNLMRLKGGDVEFELRVGGIETGDLGDPTWIRIEALVRVGQDETRRRFSLERADAASLVTFLRGVSVRPDVRARTVQFLDDPMAVHARGSSDHGTRLRFAFPGDGPAWATGCEDGWWWMDLDVPVASVAEFAEALRIDLPTWP
jgi:hypothetical protein